MTLLGAMEQVLLAPNFKATVIKSLYEDPDHPGCSFVDLHEIRDKLIY